MSFHFAGTPASQSGTAAPALPSHIEHLIAGAPTVAPEAAVMQLVRIRADFEALETEWNALFDRTARPEQMFQSFNWLWHWTQHFTMPGTRDLAIVTVRRNGALIGVLPLVVERAFGLKQLAFMGAPVSQYGDVLLAADDAAPETIAAALRFAITATRANVVRLAKVRDGSQIAAALPHFNATETAAEEAPYIDLTKYADFAAYQERFSNKARKNRRRLQRRLEERGAIVAQWHLAGADGAEAAKATLGLKRVWLKERGQLSRAFADKRTDAFFAAACAQQARPSDASVSLLRSGGEIANAAITVSAKGTQALHILAYGTAFEKCAPGVLHVEKLIEQAFAQEHRTFDFLAPRHDYKNEWADGAVRVADYAVPVTAFGRIYTHVYLGFVREQAKAAVKAAANHMRAPLSFLQSTVSRLRR
jgi:CelD/BcsL family acetyltransferase involved in cellulose biosynthesis